MEDGASDVATDRVPTNLRLLLILEIIGKAGRPMTPTEINARLELPKQSVHRLCATMVEEGFLTYVPGGKRLIPARRSRAVASGILFSARNYIARHQLLMDVAASVGETVNFVVPEADGMNYVDRVETDWPFRVQLPIGTNVPFHCTASGKTFLATLAPTARRRMVEGLALEARTPRTITDAEALMRETTQIARQGYAIDNEEFMEGMVAISVPVRDTEGRFVAALAYHGPAVRLKIDAMIAGRAVLQRGAERLSRILIDDD